MAMVAHFDLELHQIDVKTAFLNGDLYKDVNMVQLEEFLTANVKDMVFMLKKLIYGLKQALR